MQGLKPIWGGTVMAEGLSDLIDYGYSPTMYRKTLQKTCVQMFPNLRPYKVAITQREAWTPDCLDYQVRNRCQFTVLTALKVFRTRTNPRGMFIGDQDGDPYFDICDGAPQPGPLDMSPKAPKVHQDFYVSPDSTARFGRISHRRRV